MVNYAVLKEVSLPFDTVLKKLPQELNRKSFEVLSTIRIDNEIKKQLGLSFRRYAILGVCNLPLSYKALLHEELFGLVLSCTIIVYEKNDSTAVGVIRPTHFIPLLQNEFLSDGAKTVERKLTEVLETLEKRKREKKTKETKGKAAVVIKAVA